MSTFGVLGHLMVIPDSVSYAIIVNFTSSVNKTEQHNEERAYYLNITFVAGKTEINDNLLLARRRICGVEVYEYNPALFRALQDKTLTEEAQYELALFIKQQCDQGQVRKQDVTDKFFDLMGIPFETTRG